MNLEKMAEKYRDAGYSERNVEHSGDRNWLQIDVGVAFKMIQDFLETVNL